MRQRWQGVRAALLRQCPNHHHSIMPVSTAAPHALQRTPHPTLPPVGWLGGHFQLVRGQDLLPHSRDRRRRSAPRHRDGADARLPGEHCRPATDACAAAQSTADPPQTPAQGTADAAQMRPERLTRAALPPAGLRRLHDPLPPRDEGSDRLVLVAVPRLGRVRPGVSH